MQIQNTSCQISTGGSFWVRIVSFTVQLSVKKKQKPKNILTKVSGLSLLMSVVTLSSVSALTILLQQGPVSCLCFLNQRRKSSD